MADRQGINTFEVQLGSGFGLRTQALDFFEVRDPGIGVWVWTCRLRALPCLLAWERAGLAGPRRHLYASDAGRRGAITGTWAGEGGRGTPFPLDTSPRT
jgi:hypothetical protein